VALVATDNLPFVDDDPADGKATPAAEVNHFNGAAAFRLLRRQVEMGPRPSGSPESRQLADLIKRIVPRGRFQEVPHGLRNVIGTVHGREPGYIVVGAHYDTKDINGFVGANDGASGTAIVLQLARTLKRPRHSIKFVFFDGEEAPRGVPDTQFERYGLRGSKVAAPVFRDARAMILLDFVGDKHLAIKRESYSDVRLWKRLRETAQRVGAGAVFPATEQGGVLDDHIPFLRQRVRSIDLIDFDFPCWHRNCDDMSAVSERSVDAVGETMYEFLRGL
jgi:hypothetical protein